MQIHGPAHLHGPQPISAPHANRAASPSAPTPAAGSVDQLEISEAARIAAQLSEIPEVRADRIAEIRAEISAGTYETQQRLSGTVDRLLDEIG